MKLLLFFSVLSAFTISAFTASFSIIEKRKELKAEELIDYNCGEISFTHEFVENAASVGFEALPKLRLYPLVFKAPFYDENLDLLIWPLIANTRSGIFFVVFDCFGEVKDVIAKTISSQFVKCNKISKNLSVESDVILSETNGFDCGYDHFEDEIINGIATLAFNAMNRNLKIRSRHTILDPGPDYGNFLWPIPKAKNFKIDEWTRNAYFIVLTSAGEIKELRVKLMDGSFLKCPKFKIPEHLPSNQLKESQDESGFQCGNYFFGMNYLERSKKFALRLQTNQYKKKYPMRYKGPPFITEVYLNPVFTGGRFYLRGQTYKHFAVMSYSFEIIGVVVKAKSGYHLCEAVSRSAESFKETSGFKCGKVEFTQDHLETTAKLAFEKFAKRGQKFPAKYEGPDFEVVGPYLTWPLLLHSYFTKGDYRVVLSKSFNVVGVIHRFDGAFYKCRRTHDDSIPGGESEGEIREIYKAYRMDII